MALEVARFDAEPTGDENDCETSVAATSPCGGAGGLAVPEGATTLYLAAEPLFDASDFTVSVEVAEAGCRSVVGNPSATASDASALLLPGTYLAYGPGSGNRWEATKLEVPEAASHTLDIEIE